MLGQSKTIMIIKVETVPELVHSNRKMPEALKPP